MRYRTGDMVERTSRRLPGGPRGMWLPQGILGRVDDMVVIRGMNVFPSAIEEILRRSRGVGEFSITFYNDPHAMDEVKVEVELAHARDGARRSRRGCARRSGCASGSCRSSPGSSRPTAARRGAC